MTMTDCGSRSDERSFADERWVRIMCDFGADGVWHKDGCGDCVEELPVNAELIERIRRWQDWHDSQDVPVNLTFDRDAFSAEGLAIARAVKAALPDWTVIYYDEAAAMRVGPDQIEKQRHHFEYEVT